MPSRFLRRAGLRVPSFLILLGLAPCIVAAKERPLVGGDVAGASSGMLASVQGAPAPDVTSRAVLAMSPQQREAAVQQIVERQARQLLSPNATTGVRKSNAEFQADRQKANALYGYFVRLRDSAGKLAAQPAEGLKQLPTILQDGRPVAAQLLAFVETKVSADRAARMKARPAEPDWLIAKDDSYQRAYFSLNATTEMARSAYDEMEAELDRAFWAKVDCDRPPHTIPTELDECTENATFDGVNLVRWIAGDAKWYKTDGTPVAWLTGLHADSHVFDVARQGSDVPSGWGQALNDLVALIGTREKVDMFGADDGSRIWLLRGPNVNPVPLEQIIVQSVHWVSLDVKRAAMVPKSFTLRIPCVGNAKCVYKSRGDFANEVALPYLEVTVWDDSRAQPTVAALQRMEALYERSEKSLIEAFDDDKCWCVLLREQTTGALWKKKK